MLQLLERLGNGILAPALRVALHRVFQQPFERAHQVGLHFANQQLAGNGSSLGDHQVDTVSDGTSAREAVQRLAYDVIFMDLHMPDIDGFTATGLIRVGADYAAADSTPPTLSTWSNLVGDAKKPGQ